MISVFASGFIGRKPELLLVGRNRRQKVEFDVIWERREKDRATGEWGSVYERATFVAWDDDAAHIAERFDKGTQVTCTGTQRTSKWKPPDGPERTFVKYDLTDFNIVRRAPAAGGESPQPQPRSDARPDQRPAPSRPQGQPENGRKGGTSEPAGGGWPPEDDPFPGAVGERDDGNETGRSGERQFLQM